MPQGPPKERKLGGIELQPGLPLPSPQVPSSPRPEVPGPTPDHPASTALKQEPKLVGGCLEEVQRNSSMRTGVLLVVLKLWDM